MKSKQFYELFQPDEIVNVNCYNSQLNLTFTAQKVWKNLRKQKENLLHVHYSETNKLRVLII